MVGDSGTPGLETAVGETGGVSLGGGRVGVTSGDTVWLACGLGVAGTEPSAVGLGPGLGVALGSGLADGAGDGVSTGRVATGVRLLVGVALAGGRVAVRVAVGPGGTVALAADVALPTAVGLGMLVGLAIGRGVSVGGRVATGVALGNGLALAVALGPGLAVAMTVGLGGTVVWLGV